MTAKPDFVLLVAISPDGQNVALLRKDHGPQDVVGKLTFPGGHREPTDASHHCAAAREGLEEANIRVDARDLAEIDFEDGERHSMRTFLGVADLTEARPMTSEHVFVAGFDAVLAAAAGSSAHYYGPRVVEILHAALPHVERLRNATPAPKVPPRYASPCERPNFRQSLDKERPHELTDLGPHGMVTKQAPSHRAQLVYRYLDTGETVIVPHVWYNATPAMRACTLRFEAQRREEKVAAMRARVPTGWTQAMVENLAGRMLANAWYLRDLAERVQAGALTPSQQMEIHKAEPLQPEDAPSLAWGREQEQRQSPAPSTAGTVRPRMRS